MLRLCFTPFTDYCLHARGNQEEQHLGAEYDWTNLVQCNELCGVEQEGGAGHRTSHQTFKGDISVVWFGRFLHSVAITPTRLETE